MPKFLIFSLFVTVFSLCVSSAQAQVFLSKKNANESGKTTLFNGGSGDSEPKNGPIFFNKQLKSGVNSPVYNAKKSKSGTVFRPVQKNISQSERDQRASSLMRANKQANLQLVKQQTARNQILIERDRAERKKRLDAMKADYAAQKAEKERQEALAAAAGAENTGNVLPQTTAGSATPQVKKVYVRPKSGLSTPKKVFNSP